MVENERDVSDAGQQARLAREAEASREIVEAQRLADLWIVRYLMGVAHVESRAYAAALYELELCEKRRGEATAVFLDDIPTYRYMVPLSYWLGRAHEGLGARDAADRHLRAYLALRSPATDPLAKDAAARVAAKSIGGDPAGAASKKE